MRPQVEQSGDSNAFSSSREILGFGRADVRFAANLFVLTLRKRFLGTRLGLVWAFMSPVLMLSIFTFVFGFVFKAKLPGAESSLAYVTWLIAGYGAWLAIAEGLSSSTDSVVSNAGIIKNMRVKTELLPIVGALMGIVPLTVGLFFLCVLLVAGGASPSWTWIVVVPTLVLQFVFVMGIGLMLAALNVFVRDVTSLLPNVLLILLFSSPIFFPIETFPGVFATIERFNPFYIITEGVRAPLLFQRTPPLWAFLYLGVVALGTFAFGLRFFRSLKGSFDARL